MKAVSPLTLLAALAAPVGSLAAQSAGEVVAIPHTDRAPQIESFLNRDPPTTALVVSDFRQREPGDGVPASVRTVAYLSYDEANLYVVFVCHDDRSKVRASVARREEISADDYVVIFLDTFRDRERAYVFAANPFGVQLDGIVTEGQSDDYSFDAVWTSSGQVTDEGYVVRMAIPFRNLRFANGESQTWGVGLGRIIRRNNEEVYWPYITKRVQGFVPQLAPLGGLTRISPGRNIQLNPYSVLARARVLDFDRPGLVTNGDQRIGLDAKMVVRDAVTVDATVNPDFSQVETDDPQVTVNERFEVFFPEKRPFFLENAGYFQTPVNLLFSRRLVDPGLGLRVTGKLGGWALGAIALNDRAAGRLPPDDPFFGREAGVGAVRVQRELGEQSTVGVLATDREFADGWNRVVSADARWKVGGNWALLGQVMRSDQREPGGARTSGLGAVAEVSGEGRNVEYAGRYEDLSPDFATPLGFVRRVGFRQTEHEVKYRVRPGGRTVLSFGPIVSVLLNWDRQGVLQDREIKTEFLLELAAESELKFERVQALELFEGLRFNPYANVASASTEWLKWLRVDASYAWGTAVNHDPAEGLAPSLGSAREAEMKLTLRPAARLRLDQAYVQSSLDTRPGAARIFTERKLRSKLNYQFSRLLSLRAIADYTALDADTTLTDEERERKWSVDLLLTYLVHPGTALYLGYTDRSENLAILPGSPPTVRRGVYPFLSVGRQVFVKVSYLLRF